MAFFLFCILVDRPMGGAKAPPPPTLATLLLRLPFCVLKASAQVTKGGMPQFCILFMLIILSWRPKGGPWPNGPLPWPQNFFVSLASSLVFSTPPLSNSLDPDFGRSSLRLSRFFSPNLDDLKKKGSSLRLSRYFCPNLGDLKKGGFSSRLKPLVEITTDP